MLTTFGLKTSSFGSKIISKFEINDRTIIFAQPFRVWKLISARVRSRNRTYVRSTYSVYVAPTTESDTPLRRRMRADTKLTIHTSRS